MDKKYGKQKNSGFVRGMMTGILLCAVGAVLVIGGLSTVTSRQRRRTADSDETGSSSVSLTEDAEAFRAELEGKLKEINSLIDENFIFEVDEEQMMDGLLSGYLEGLDDVYSLYYTPEEFEEAISDSDGSYVGIGVAVEQDTETLAITALTVYSGSPAEGAGMQSGDILKAVDGKDISGEILSDVVDQIRGEEGSEVTVTVLRDGETLDLTMTRTAMEMETAEYEMLEEGIGYIQLTEFDSVSVDQMKEAIQELREQGMEKLILDLRDNPGGLLTSVVSIADLFLPKGDNIFYAEDKKGNQTRYDSESDPFCTETLSVLVNGNSASASEVLSGSLKDHERAVLVGTQTFGKGIVQTFYRLSDGSGIKLTTAHYFTPSGTDIHGIGIEPDLAVEDDAETEEDEVLEAALEEIRSR